MITGKDCYDNADTNKSCFVNRTLLIIEVDFKF